MPEHFVDPAMDMISKIMLKRDKLQAEVDRLKSMTYCAYCGEEFPIDDDAGEVSEHIRTCDKHPMREAQATADRRLELLREIIARVSFCPICMAGYLNDFGTYEHAEDCRLKKELSDATLGG